MKQHDKKEVYHRKHLALFVKFSKMTQNVDSLIFCITLRQRHFEKKILLSVDRKFFPLSNGIQFVFSFVSLNEMEQEREGNTRALILQLLYEHVKTL